MPLLEKLYEINNPTLEAVDKIIEEESRPSLGYMACGNIGEDCNRMLWYSKRMCKQSRFNAKTLRLFKDGHDQEALMAERLRKVKGVKLWTEDEDGKQFGVEFVGGHLKGYVDGVIVGLLEAPKTAHVWEHKCVGEQQYKKLCKLLTEHDEKNVLKIWNKKYYAQHILYMYGLELKRGFLTVSTPGGRDYVSVRTASNNKEAKQYIKKAKEIIFADTPPARISNDPTSFACRFCFYIDICHEQKLGAHKNCRTCAHITPKEDGTWQCENANIPEDERGEMRSNPYKGCKYHNFNPKIFSELYEIGLNGEGLSMQVEYSNAETGEVKTNKIGTGDFR